MQSINIAGELIELTEPRVMGIVNITPDSFYQDSRAEYSEDIINSVSNHLKNGATFIDIGGYSTRPMSDFVPPEEEIKRVTSALDTIGNRFGNSINLSIDTFRSEVVEAALKVWQKEFIVNDVMAAEQDSRMLRIVAENGLPYIAMHSINHQTTEQQRFIVNEVLSYFVKKLEQIRSYCIKDVIFDVGFGFAKNINQNYELVKRFEEFNILGIPQLVGVSRKRMIWQELDIKVSDALNGTTVVNTLLLQKGAKILRVHDSLEAMQIIKILNKAKWDF